MGEPLSAEEIAQLVGTTRPVVTNWRQRPTVHLCTCHREGYLHELCCGRPEGRDPNCPIHGDGG